MDATFTSWYNCNEEAAQWHCDNNNSTSDTDKGNNNTTVYTSTMHINSNNNINNNNNIDTQVTFNHSKSAEVRQTRLQRQREVQQSPASLKNLTPLPSAFTQLNCEKSTHSSTTNSHPLPQTPHRAPPRRKRLQRQKPTEVDDVDFAYAADLEEEEEDEEEQQQQQQQQQLQQQPTAIFNSNPLVFSSTRNEQVTTPTFASKCLQHFQQQLHIASTAKTFDGQPSSLPNDITATAATMMGFPQQHQQQQQEHQQHFYQHQHRHHHHQHQHHYQQHRERRLRHEESFDSSTTTTTNTTDTATSPASPLLRRHNFSLLKRDNSTHSDSSSHYSSVDSLLEARKPDPEAILINLGFGPVGSEDILSRIPKRFLKPSQVRGIDTEAFIRRLQLASNLADHSVLGYRGLTGNPDIPPSRIVAKIMQRFEVNERKKSMGSIEQTI